MFTFKDSKNREWDVTLNLGAAQRIDNSDFSKLLPPGTQQPSFTNMDKELLLSIFDKPSLLFAMIWAVVQPQVPKNIPQEDYKAAELEFVESIDGKARNAGRKAFLDACGDFFPELRTALSTLGNQWSRLQSQVEQEIVAVEPELQARLDREVKRGLANLRRELASDEEKAGEKSTA